MTAPESATAGRVYPDLRLLPAAAGNWAGSWWATGVEVGRTLVVALLGAAIGALLGRALVVDGRTAPGRLRTVLVAAFLVLAFGVAGTVATAVHQQRRTSGPFAEWVTERAVVQLRGQVVSDPRPVAAGVFEAALPLVAVRLAPRRVTARATAVDVDHRQVVVIGSGSWAEVSAGQQLTVVGRLRPTDRGDDAVAVLWAQGSPTEVASGGAVWRLADRVRAGLREACRGLPREGGGLLPSLAVGDTSVLPSDLDADLRVAGLTHLTVVSGANVTIIAGVAVWLGTLLGVRRRPRLVLAFVSIAGFAVVARPDPSVLRASVMGAIGLTGLLAARRPRGVPILAGAVLVLLVGNPWLARSLGFALSCAATLALLLLAPIWARQLARFMPYPLAVAVSVPAAAQAACGPLIVLVAPSLPAWAVPANLLVEPAVAPATVLGVAAAGLAPVWPGAAHLVAGVGAVATGWIAVVGHRIAALPGAEQPWPPGLPGAVLLGGLTVVVIWLTTRREWAGPRDEPFSAQRCRPRRPVRPSPVLAAVLILGAVVFGWWAVPRLELPGRLSRWPPSEWAVAACDVGQGDALVVRSGQERAVLIDAGPDPDLIDRCLARLRIHQLDLVILTHFHADHVAGLPGALRGRAAARVLVSPLAEPQTTAAEVSAQLSRSGARSQPALAGATGVVGDGGWQVTWRVHAPREMPSSAGGGSDEGDSGAANEASVVSELTVETPTGRVRVFCLGDLERAGQRTLSAAITGPDSALDGPVDVVKVAHHGSSSQDPGLYSALGARLAIVSVGADNDYGHPATSAVTALRAGGATVVRTDLSGDLTVQPRPDGRLLVRGSQ